jgi:hypothetical protein
MLRPYAVITEAATGGLNAYRSCSCGARVRRPFQETRAMATSRSRKKAAPAADPAPSSLPAGSARIHAPDVQKNIAETAYYLWEQQGRPHGRDVDFWVEAEKIVLSRSV